MILAFRPGHSLHFHAAIRTIDPPHRVQEDHGHPPQRHELKAPLFRFPALRHSTELVSYLGTRNVGIFSTDVDSFDFKTHKPEAVIASVMTKLQKNSKGIVLMHDFQHATALALPELLVALKAGGYKIVQVKTKEPVTTLAAYDQQLEKELGGSTTNLRAISSVVRTIDTPNFNDRFSAIR